MSRAPAGRRIRDRRGDMGLKQADLARACGISPSYLNLIEHGRRPVGGKLLSRLADALGTDAAALRDGAGQARLADLADAADRTPADPAPERERAEDFAGRFPGWAALIARQAAGIAALERQVAALTERTANDPILADALHDMLSTVTSIRAASAILAGPDEVEPDWQARFHRNIFEDSQRLAEASQGLTRHLDTAAAPGAGAGLPQDEVEAWFAARDFHVPELERHVPAAPAALVAGAGLSDGAAALARQWLDRYAADARAIPMARLKAHAADGPEAADPMRLAGETGQPLSVALRRLATLAEVEAGLVICDGSGATVWRKPVAGFPLPRFGAGCPLWPLYAALRQPGTPVRARVEQPGRPPSRATCIAVADQSWPAGFDGPAVIEAAMLILPERGGPGGDARPVGPTCRVCPRATCPARREPSAIVPAAP